MLLERNYYKTLSLLTISLSQSFRCYSIFFCCCCCLFISSEKMKSFFPIVFLFLFFHYFLLKLNVHGKNTCISKQRKMMCKVFIKQSSGWYWSRKKKNNQRRSKKIKRVFASTTNCFSVIVSIILYAVISSNPWEIAIKLVEWWIFKVIRI